MGSLHQPNPATGRILNASTLLAMPPNRDTVVEELGDELVLTRPKGWRFLGGVLLLILVSSTYLFVAIPLDAMGIIPLLPERLRERPFRPRPPGKPIKLRPSPAAAWLLITPTAVGLPFLIAWTVGHLTGFDQVRIGPRGVEHLRGTLLRKRRRSVPLSEVRSLVSEENFTRPSLIVTWGPPIPLGGYFANSAEQEWLTDLVRRKLLDLKARDRSSSPPPSPPTVAVSLVPRRVTFSTLHEEDAETDRIDRISGFGGCLVPTLFVNGMVALVLLETFTPFEWSRHWRLLLSLIPGLFMALVSMGMAYETFAWRIWTFDADELVEGYYFLGVPIGGKVRYTTHLLGSVELKMVQHCTITCSYPTFTEFEICNSYPLGLHYWLEFTGRDGKPFDRIAGITARDALWLMRELSNCLKGTLNRSEATLTLPPAPADSL